jgi:hypothetical protein
MGDRCYLEIKVRKCDLPAVSKIVNGEFSDSEERWWNEEATGPNSPVMRLMVYEANYAWVDIRTKIAETGIPFYGSWESGGSYGPGEYVGFEGQHYELDTFHGGFAVSVDETLKINGKELADIAEFIEKFHTVRKLFGEEVE